MAHGNVIGRLLGLMLWTVVGCSSGDGGGWWGGRKTGGNEVVGSVSLAATTRPPTAPPDPLPPQGLEAVTGFSSVGMDGTYHYTIPIEVLPGRAGMTPKVALSYSSAAGNGTLGVGWSLKAGSMISRCDAIPASGGIRDRVVVQTSGQYCLDGQRLVYITGTGTAGQVNSQFRTEVESFSRIKVVEATAQGPTKWSVEQKDGRILTYGALPESVVPSGPWTQRRVYNANGTLNGSLSTVTMFWPLVEEKDRFSNQILYEYERSNNSQTGNAAPILSKIRYGRCTSCGYPNTKDRTVEFTYEPWPPADTIERWVNGVPIVTTKRLFQVGTMSWDGTTPTVLRRYTLKYLPESADRLTKRNLLWKVSACDAAGGSGGCTPWTRFNWQATAPSGYRQHGGGYNEFSYEGNLDNTHLMETVVFDANSDGNDDVLLYEPSAPGIRQDPAFPDPENPIGPITSTTYTPKVLLGDGGGHFSSAVNVALSNQPYPCVIYQPSRSIPIDLDGNGTTELVVECARTGQQIGQPVTATYRVLSWQGNPGALSEVTVEGLTGRAVENHQTVINLSCAWMSSGILRFGDLTGDGLPEMLSAANNGTWMMQVAQRTQQAATGAPRVRYAAAIDTKLRAIGPNTCQAPMSVTTILDQDGDGHAELAQIDMGQAIRSYTRLPWSTTSHSYQFLDVANNVSWTVEREEAGEPLSGTRNWGTANFQAPTGVRPWFFVDINGDGLKDALFQAGTTWNTRINSGAGYAAATTLPAGAVTTALDENTYDPNAWWTRRQDHGLQIADMNGDGRDDIVLFASPNNDQPWLNLNLRWRRSIDPVRILYSNGTGFDAPVALNVANNMIWARRPRPGAPQFAMSGLGDVNGDGLTDVIGMTVVSGTIPRRKLMTWSYGDALPGGVDRLKSVQIEGISEDNGIVDAVFYDNMSANSVARNGGLATWDTHAPKRGGDYPAASTARGTVVKRHFSQGRNEGKQTVRHFRYSGGVNDKTGRGFVGFSEVKIMDLLTGVFTKHTFNQNPVLVGPSSSFRHYIGAKQAVATQTWDAPDSSMQPAPDNFYGLRPATGTVVTQRRNVSTVYEGHPLRMTWQNVVLNDFYAPNGRPPYSSIDTTPYESTTTTFDTWGNPTSTVYEYTDLSAGERKYTRNLSIEFTNNETAWLIGRPRLVTETSSTKNPYLRELENGDTGIFTETSVTEFFNSPTTGVPDWIVREAKVIADNPNTTVYEPGAPELKMMQFFYNSAGLVTTLREHSASRTTCTTQPCGCSVDADCGGTQVCSYATAGAVRQCFETRNYGFEYDPTGTFAEGFSNPLGQKRWELYDPKRLWLYATVDENDVMTKITRDTFGRPRTISSDTGAGQTLTYETSDRTRILRVSRNGGPSTVTFLDVYGRPELEVWSTFSGGSGVVRELYDVLGNARERSYKASTDPISRTGSTRSLALSASNNGTITLSTRYDTAGRPVSIASSPTAAGTTYTYPALGTVTEFDAGGLRTDTLSDHTGRITRRTQYTASGAAKSVFYRYKGNGELALVGHPDADERYVYDAAGRLRVWRTTRSEDEYERWSGNYNGFDQLVSETRDGIVATYTRDKLDRLRTRSAAGEIQSYYWDPPGGIGHIDRAEAINHVIRFSDFNRGRPGQRIESFDGGQTRLSFGYTYDGFGRLDTLRYPEGTTLDVTAGLRAGMKPGPTVKYNYRNGQILSITEPSNGNAKLWEVTERHVLGMVLRANYGAALPTTWTYKASTLDLETHGTTGVTSGPAPTQSFVFSLNGRLSTRTTNGILEDFRYDGSTGMLDVYHRDPTGTKRIEANFDYASTSMSAMTTVFSGTASTDWPNVDETFTNKWPPELFQIDTHTSVSTSGTTTQTYTYDAAGRVDQVRQNGTVVRDFDWNSFNLPTRVSYSNPSVTRTFAYDAFGSRVKKTQDASNEVLYAGKLYESRNLSGNRESVFRLYADVGVIAELSHPWSATTRTTRYLFTDHQGSPAFQVVENGSTRASTQLGFFPFGKRQNTAPTQKFSQLGYTGHVQDDDLGLIDMEGRVFDTTTRRFLTRDKVADRPLFVGGPNPYSYVANDPINMVDPSGFQAIPDCCDEDDEDRAEVVIYVDRSDDHLYSDDPIKSEETDSPDSDDMCVDPSFDESDGGYDEYDPFGNYGWGFDPQTGVPLGPPLDREGLENAFTVVGLTAAAAYVAFEAAALIPIAIAAAKAPAVNNKVPDVLARAIPGKGPFTTLAVKRPDAYVTAAKDIAGMNSKQIAERLGIPPSQTFTVIQFSSAGRNLASPVNRLDPGFVGRGLTSGGAREFVLPNGPIPSDATITIVGP